MESSSPKILSGFCKGLKLKVKKGDSVRPTPVRVREAVMSRILEDLEGATFWDLCAGSGAMGIEAMSRGAHHVFWVESDRQAAFLLKDNIASALQRFKNQDLAEPETGVQLCNVSQAIAKLPKASVIWADPPWAMVERELLAWGALLDAKLESGGVFILESAKGTEIPVLPWDLEWKRSYGQAEVSLWRKA
ncbi:MAG: RsmD family RNA methyltransferase [Oligoflexales bacterium]